MNKVVHGMQSLESQTWRFNLPGPAEKILYVNLFTALKKRVQLPVDPVKINRELVTRVLVVDEALLAEKVPGCFEPFGQTSVAKAFQNISRLDHIFRSH